MINQLKKSIFAITYFLLLFCTQVLGNENRILLKINNEIITSIDILNEIKYLSLVNNEFKNLNKNKKIEIAKSSLIREQIKYIEIKKFTKKIILEDNFYEKIIKTNFSNLNLENILDFKKFLKKQDLELEFIKKKISIDVLWNQLIYEKFSKNVKLDKNEIETNISKKENLKEYSLSEIVFNVNENEKFEEKLLKIENTINKKNFSAAALTHSISDSSQKGGKLGWIKENVLSDNIRKKLDSLKMGERTDALVIPGGFLILKVDNVKISKRKINKEKELNDIIRRKTNDQLNLFSNIYLNKLKKNVVINEI